MTSPIIGIPTTRVSDQFIRQRLLNQVQYNQSELLRVQTQLSTGHRFVAPSEDPVAAMRVANLQQLLLRKDQMKSNLTTSQSYLSATDSALSNVSSLLAEARGNAIGALGTTASDTQRQAAAAQIKQLLDQLVDTGNAQFRGRYLFAGSKTTAAPFQSIGASYVEYSGNEQRFSSYADIDQLFQTNLDGNSIFGTISNEVRGGSDLNPILTYNTRLADLRGGQGISHGSISISDGNNTSNIDISKAETVGDLAKLIKANPPAGRALNVDIADNRLIIQFEPAAGITTNLSIREVGGGTTANELGVLRETGVGNQPVEGSDLNPLLRSTTPLGNILGVRANTVVHSAGADNDFILEAGAPGAQTAGGMDLNGVSIQLINDDAVTEGNEVVDYNTVDKKIVVHIDANHTKASEVVDKINQKYDSVLFPFRARLDPIDEKDGGKGVVEAGAGAATRDGSGERFDQNFGLQIVNAGKTFTISLASAQTVEDVLNIINGSGAGVLAEINSSGTGIDVRSRVSGCDFAIGENGGTTAAQLGLRTFTRDTPLEDLNHGRGVEDYTGTENGGADFSITRSDGVSFFVNITGAKTIGDVLDLINDSPCNTGGTLVARLAAKGNGIELLDTSNGAGQLTVTKAALSHAAIDLGLIPEDADANVASTPGAVQTITGRDVNLKETESIFTALLRMQSGLQSNDTNEVQRAIDMLDKKVSDMNFTRAELGARQQGLDVVQQRQETENIELQKVLSTDYDADLAQAASDFSSLQASYEASLKATAMIFQLSLLNYLQ
jgi:flagellin-like hook-associated protein FlgL